MHDACAGLSDLRNVARRQPDAMHDAQAVVQQPGAVKHVKQRGGGGGARLSCRGSLDARFVDMGQDRQSVPAG
jgi:hypothetical protein